MVSRRDIVHHSHEQMLMFLARNHNGPSSKPKRKKKTPLKKWLHELHKTNFKYFDPSPTIPITCPIYGIVRDTTGSPLDHASRRASKKKATVSTAANRATTRALRILAPHLTMHCSHSL